MDLVRAIQLQALRQSLLPSDDDGDARLRHIFRWYSREFSTPLERVEDLPLVDVLTHYFESMYEDMEEADLEKERKTIVETEDERIDRMMRGDREKVDEMEFIRKVEADEQERIRLKKEAERHRRESAADVRQPLRQEVAEIEKTAAGPTGRSPVGRMKESSLPTVRTEPVMRVTFTQELVSKDVEEADSLGSATSSPGRRRVFER